MPPPSLMTFFKWVIPLIQPNAPFLMFDQSGGLCQQKKSCAWIEDIVQKASADGDKMPTKSFLRTFYPKRLQRSFLSFVLNGWDILFVSQLDFNNHCFYFFCKSDFLIGSQHYFPIVFHLSKCMVNISITVMFSSSDSGGR